MIISSISYKGGVGKSTVAQNLAVTLAHQGHKVCIVDADLANVSVKWAGERLARELKPHIQVISMTDEKALVGTVREQYNDYDVIIIDSPPSYNPISVKIMLCSHVILMPIKPTGKSELWTARDLLERYDNVQEMKDEKTPAHFVVNDYESRPSFHKIFIESLKEIAEEFNVGVMDTIIHHRIAYGEVNSMGMGVIEYNNDKAIQEFQKLTREVLAADQ